MDNNQKVKTKSFRDIFGDDSSNENSQGVTEVDISKLIPYENHMFKLYSGERLKDMIQSVKSMGIIVPIIVRPYNEEFYQILSGHNRINAAKIAGLKTVPTVIKENLNDDDATLIVIETNLIQRSFSDMSHSERAISLLTHYNILKRQGARTDLIREIETLLKPHEINNQQTSSQVAKKLTSLQKVGQNYSLSKDTVARYIRLNELIPSLLQRVDNEEIPFIPAVTLSFVRKTEQQYIESMIFEYKFKIDMAKAQMLRLYSEEKMLTGEIIHSILSGEKIRGAKLNKPREIKLKVNLISKYFSDEQSQSEIETIIEKALGLYFTNNIEINS